MNSNTLKLNTVKTEVMPAGSASRLESVDSESANIGGNKYPGVHLDLPRAQTYRVNPTLSVPKRCGNGHIQP